MWSVLAATGSAFQDANNPVPMLQIGTRGQTGIAHLVDLMISTMGPVPGAKLILWNLHDPANSPGLSHSFFLPLFHFFSFIISLIFHFPISFNFARF